MKVYKNLTLVGTSHIAIESVKEVEKVILGQQPEIVAVELDRGRFLSLKHKDKKSKHGLAVIRKYGVKGYLFAKMGEFVEKYLGRKVGVSPGADMMKAVEVAKKVKAKVAFVDQPIDITMKRFSQEITWKEKFRFVYDIIKNVIKGERIKIDLKKVPSKELIKKLMKIIKDRYPNFYKVLVTERNEYMAKHLYKIMQEYKVVAVVGAGHEKEIIDEIKCLEKKS